MLLVYCLVTVVLVALAVAIYRGTGGRAWCQCPKVPFGCAHEYWEDMKRMLRPGDALVFFRTDTRSWGDEGYAIVRRGRVIKVLPTTIHKMGLTIRCSRPREFMFPSCVSRSSG